MKASIVIVTYQRQRLVKKLVEQIRSLIPKQKWSLSTKVRVNQIYAKEEMKVLKRPRRHYYFDDDVEITKDTIESHIGEYDSPNIIGVAGRVINDGDELPQNTWILLWERQMIC